MKRQLPILLALLSGCTSVEVLRPDIAAKPSPSRLDEIAYINALRDAFVIGPQAGQDHCYDGTGLKRFNPTLAQGYNDHSDDHEEVETNQCVFFKDAPDTAAGTAAISRYLEAGFGLTDLYCERFFIVASESAQKRKFQRSAFTGLDGLVGAALNFAKAGPTAAGIVNSGFAAIDSTFQNIDDSFLVAPDIGNVRKLVHAAQADFRQQTFNGGNTPTSYPGARSIIERYAGLCTYPGMKQLVNDSVTSETRDIAKDVTRNAGTVTQPNMPDAVAMMPPEAPSAPRPDAIVLVPPTPN